MKLSRLLLSNDDYVYYHNGAYYAGRQDLLEFYQRYLRVFDCVRLVARCIEEPVLKQGRVPLHADHRIEFIPIPEFHGPKEYAFVYFKVGRIVNEAIKDCDAAIIRIPSTVALRVGSLVKRIGLPYACEVVFDAKDGEQSSSGINRLAWKVINQRMKDLCSAAKGVSCVTEHYLQRHYYPADPDAFTSYYSSLSLPVSFYGSAREFPHNKTFVIAHIANQIEFKGRKGHLEIIKAVGLLAQRGCYVHVKFAGKDYNGGISKLKAVADSIGVSNLIDFVGFLDRDEIDRLLCEADLFVLPTKAEGLPRVIIEAMAKGLPCITTPVSGNPELVDNQFLVPYNDIEELAKRIEQLCSDAALYEDTSYVNFERSKKYESSVLERRRDEFYRKLLNMVDQ